MVVGLVGLIKTVCQLAQVVTAIHSNVIFEIHDTSIGLILYILHIVTEKHIIAVHSDCCFWLWDLHWNLTTDQSLDQISEALWILDHILSDVGSGYRRPSLVSDKLVPALWFWCTGLVFM